MLADAWTSTGPAVRAMTLDFARVTATRTAHTPAPFPELLTLVTHIIESGQSKGEFDPTRSPAFVASTIGGLLGGITMYWLATRRGRLDRAMHEALDLLIAGLATTPKKSRR